MMATSEELAEQLLPKFTKPEGRLCHCGFIANKSLTIIAAK
jgi:hypothetical protein